MAKIKAPSAWPWRIRGMYIVLGLSLAVNGAALATLVFLESREGVFVLVNEATQSACDRNYDVIAANLKADRKRFTVLHELGHILMRVNHHPEKEREFYCHSFAGAMLIPKEALRKELGPSRTQIYLNELVYLKKQFGASIQAIVYRAKHLGIVSESFFKNFMIYFSMKGYKKNEPGEYNGYEKSNRFKQLIYRAVAEEIISTSKAAALDNKRLSEFRDELALYEK